MTALATSWTFTGIRYCPCGRPLHYWQSGPDNWALTAGPVASNSYLPALAHCPQCNRPLSSLSGLFSQLPPPPGKSED